jgi:hypothetical protein
MKKVIRLTETDLTRIVKRVIEEGGYDGIKKELKVRRISSNLAGKMVHNITKLILGFKKLKSNLQNDITEYNFSTAAKGLLNDFSKMSLTLIKLKEFMLVFDERGMRLHKSDFEDYDVNLEEILDDLEKCYDKIRELEEIVDDKDILGLINGLEEKVDEIVELLYNIPD